MLSISNMDYCDCKKCGHHWAKRKESNPERCPRCNNLKWWNAKSLKFTNNSLGKDTSFYDQEKNNVQSPPKTIKKINLSKPQEN